MQTNFLKKRTLPIESQLCVDERTSRKPAIRSPTGRYCCKSIFDILTRNIDSRRQTTLHDCFAQHSDWIILLRTKITLPTFATVSARSRNCPRATALTLSSPRSFACPAGLRLAAMGRSLNRLSDVLGVALAVLTMQIQLVSRIKQGICRESRHFSNSHSKLTSRLAPNHKPTGPWQYLRRQGQQT